MSKNKHVENMVTLSLTSKGLHALTKDDTEFKLALRDAALRFVAKKEVKLPLGEEIDEQMLSIRRACMKYAKNYLKELGLEVDRAYGFTRGVTLPDKIIEEIRNEVDTQWKKVLNTKLSELSGEINKRIDEYLNMVEDHVKQFLINDKLQEITERLINKRLDNTFGKK